MRVIPVTLVAESTASACGCATPSLHWSGIYQDRRSVQRAYFFCTKCRTFGFFSVPAPNWGEHSVFDGVSGRALQQQAEASLDLLPDLPDMAGIFRRAADNVFSQRARCAELHAESIRRSIIDEAIVQFTSRAREADAAHREWLRAESERLLDTRFKLQVELDRARRTRREKAKRSLSRRKAVRASTFTVIARGEHHSGAVIYGLIDPREPERIRYVGQAKAAGSRLASHITGSQNPTSKKERWIAQLVSEGVYPDMVLLERTKPDADVDGVERWWIAQMVAKGEADTNTASVPKPIAPAAAGAR